jgi:phage gp36-like protein
MAYAVISDVLTRYPPIHSMIGTGSGEVTSLQVTSVYINDGEGFVNAYLGAKYAVPLVTEPIITSLTSDLAIYKLLEDKVPRIPEFMQRRHDNAIKTLEMLRDGKMVLSSSQTLITSGDQEAYSTTQDYHPVFSPVIGELHTGPDTDQIDAERDERLGDASPVREEWWQ